MRARAPQNSGLLSDSPYPDDLGGDQGWGVAWGRAAPTPTPRAAIPGAALRARECAPSEVALAPPSASPGRCPLSTDVQIASPRGSPFPVTTPSSGPSLPTSLKVSLVRNPRAWDSRPKSRPPPARGPQRTGEKLSPGGRAWSAGSPLPPRTFPGAVVTRGRAPPRLPPPVPGLPWAASCASGARPGSRGAPRCAAVTPPSPACFSTRVMWPARVSTRHFQKDLGSVRTAEFRVTPGLPPPLFLRADAPPTLPALRDTAGLFPLPPPLSPMVLPGQRVQNVGTKGVMSVLPTCFRAQPGSPWAPPSSWRLILGVSRPWHRERHRRSRSACSSSGPASRCLSFGHRLSSTCYVLIQW